MRMRAVVGLVALASPGGCPGDQLQARAADAPPAYERVVIVGDDAPNGNYDPSVEYDADGVGWLAYSAVTAGKQGEVATRIARSPDQGRTWTRVADVNAPSPARAPLPGGKTLKGKWWHEVPTLVHDPGDAGREWKLYWHRYISRIPHRNERDRMFAFGWIAARHAPSPKGPWSEETALIGAGPFPLAPFAASFRIGALHPDFQKYVVLTEPGSLHHDGRLYLSLQAVRDPKLGLNKHDIIMISSADHGRSWKAAGTILTAEEAKQFGATWFTGSSLVAENGRLFLMACPEVAGAGLKAHRGTVVFEFEDIDRARLRRDKAGVPIVIKRLNPERSMGGQSDYDSGNRNGGIIMPQLDMKDAPRAFGLFNTGQTIVGE